MTYDLRQRYIDVVAEGAAGDGVTNDTAVLQAAITAAAGGTLYVPPRTYLTDPLDFSSSLRIETDGYYATGLPTFKARTDGQAYVLQFKAPCTGRGVRVDCNDFAVDGVILQNGRSELTDFWVRKAKGGYEFRFDLAYGGGAGNVNLSQLIDCTADGQNTGAIGYCTPTFGANHNGIVLDNCRSLNHLSHGAMLKGHSWQVRAGNYFANGGYGIQFGEGTTESFSQSPVAWFPWLETNTLGGVNFQRSSKGVHFRNSTGGIDETVFTQQENVEVSYGPATGGGWGVAKFRSGIDGRWLEVNNEKLQAAGGTDTNRDLTLQPKGAGVVAVLGGLKVPSGATGSRPAASTVPNGTLGYFDTTLHKPLFSDGTNWRDAAGTVV